MKPHLFIDSDGVFADFDEHIHQLFGVYPRQMNDAEMWRRANAHPSFWDDMPLMPGAHEFFDAIKHVRPTVLTGCPKSDYDRAASAKLAWWKRHFGHEQVITCLSRDKALHMKNPGDWLVDDMSKNTKRWAAAGGQFIRYTGNWQMAIRILTDEGVL